MVDNNTHLSPRPVSTELGGWSGQVFLVPVGSPTELLSRDLAAVSSPPAGLTLRLPWQAALGVRSSPERGPGHFWHGNCWPHINRPGKLVGIQGTAPAVTLVFGSHTWSLTSGAAEFRANVHVTDLEWEGDNRLAGRKEGRKAFWEEEKEEKKECTGRREKARKQNGGGRSREQATWKV